MAGVVKGVGVAALPFVSTRITEALETIVEELPKALKMLKKRGGKRRGLYTALIAGSPSKVAMASTKPKPIADDVRRTINTSGLPLRGRSDRGSGDPVSQKQFQKIAKVERFKWSAAETDINSTTATPAVADGVAMCKGHGARGTPAFFINGRLMSGAQPIDRFSTVIDEELRRKP